MNIRNWICFAVVLGVATPAIAGEVEHLVQPALYAELSFGGNPSKPRSYRTGFRLDYSARVQNALLPRRHNPPGAPATQLPALFQWEFEPEGFTLLSNGLALGTVNYGSPQGAANSGGFAKASGADDSDSRQGSRGGAIAGTAILATGATVGILALLFDEFWEDFEESIDDPGENPDSSGNSGSDDCSSGVQIGDECISGG